MFKSWSKKNKIKAVFKLQFQATQVPKMKKNALMISLVPDHVGKPTVKLEKAAIQDGTCFWENPIFESVKLVRDAKSGILQEKIYHFIVATGSSKSGFLGEASIDFADFAAETEPVTVSLPLKFANSGAVLHVTIQNVEGYADQRNGEDNGALELYDDGTLKHQLSFCSTDESSYNPDEEDSDKTRAGYMEKNGGFKVSNGTSPGEANAPANHMRRRSNTDWSLGSASDKSLGHWTNSLEDNHPREKFQEPSDNSTEKLKGEIASLMRQVEVSELEIQSLQRQIEKESSRGQNMSSQIISLREERDLLKTKYEQLKSQREFNNLSETPRTLQSETEDVKHKLQAIKQELVYEKELNANLQLQLKKTQSSNSELLLEVRDLEAMLEEKDKEILDLSANVKSKKKKDEHYLSSYALAKERDDNREVDLLKQNVADLNGELDIQNKQAEELNKQIVELSLEYKLLKKENLNISLRLKQKEAEQTMLQNDHSASLTTIEQLESQVERLGEKIKNQEEEFSESLACINELQNQVRSLEKELTMQAEKFDDELAAMKCAKIEQEQRAIQAEEALRKTRHNNAITSERYQEEYRMLSLEMASRIEGNGKITKKALAEADELRQQKRVMEEMLQKCNQEVRLIADQNESKLQELLNEIDLKEKRIEQMSQELEDKTRQLEDAQKHMNEKDDTFSMQIQTLRSEFEKLMAEDYKLSKSKVEENGKITKKALAEADELRQQKCVMEEMLQKCNQEVRLIADQNESKLQELLNEIDLKEKRIEQMSQELEDKAKQLEGAQKHMNEKDDAFSMQIQTLRSEFEKLMAEDYKLSKSKQTDHVEETILSALLSEVQIFKTLQNELKHSLQKEQAEKENMKEKMSQLQEELKKKESELSTMEKKLKNNKGRAAVNHVNSTSRDSESAAPPSSTKAQTRKSKSETPKGANAASTTVGKFLGGGTTASQTRELETCSANEVTVCNTNELLNEMAVLKERNKSMENELKDMQERYSEISLKFAEVESERQELVMALRKNGKN